MNLGRTVFSQEQRLCTGLDDDRPVPGNVLLGFREQKGAIKVHTLIDLHGNFSVFVRITDGKVHDVNIPDQLLAPRPVDAAVTRRVEMKSLIYDSDASVHHPGED
jgi:hypothetical protein